MGRQWVAELAERDTVAETYLVVRKTMPLSRNGKPYLSLLLADRTGQLDARMWDNAAAVSERFDESSFVRVQGAAVKYQERLQLHITSLEAVDEATVSQVDYLPRSSVPPELMWERLAALLDTVENAHLRLLLDKVLADETFGQAFRRTPAGKSIHHARLGGLLEHTLSVCRLIDSLCAHYGATYPELLDRDLLLVAGFLHDAGKTLELSATKRFDYTDEGRLIGHLVLGHDFVTRQLQTLPDFPEGLALHLRHLLLSHHGELAHGSPKRPKTAEAWILHFADLIDCRIDQTAELVGSLPPGGWTPYQKLYDRYLWRGHQPPGSDDGAPEVDAGGEPEDGAGERPEDA